MYCKYLDPEIMYCVLLYIYIYIYSKNPPGWCRHISWGNKKNSWKQFFLFINNVIVCVPLDPAMKWTLLITIYVLYRSSACWWRSRSGMARVLQRWGRDPVKSSSGTFFLLIHYGDQYSTTVPVHLYLVTGTIFYLWTGTYIT